MCDGKVIVIVVDVVNVGLWCGSVLVYEGVILVEVVDDLLCVLGVDLCVDLGVV